ncbi:methyltransferase [Burkholderia contaminans]|nr:methyltransferase [Burkholderia contaminans]
MAPLALNTAPADVIVVPTGGACAISSSGWRDGMAAPALTTGHGGGLIDFGREPHP